ncbi:KOW domain-containing RNA-binding protein [Petroclostridium sp. X23]|jgi:ribosomal protein L14E/L6E/L27E|uniref:KOW domain-containing RNA-binding protein n=1 Tax=Petroclostridium sp. X23 TaxID=3045146 RepID=UPI0024AE4DF1|nr:KOW domain-containing RNA-binding protein [Petroclostridium sp. X23]WHH61448.1 KOW domain-containing RNA-binding protein [Petroclostridium sp. X23]
MDIYPGQIVYSTAGRDKGKYFIVIERINDEYVYLSDGDIRRIENPKKKKSKHLRTVGKDVEQLVDKLKNQQKITNAEIRKCLAAYAVELQQHKQESYSRS